MGEKYGEKQFHFYLLVMKIEEARSAKLSQLLYRQAWGIIFSMTCMQNPDFLIICTTPKLEFKPFILQLVPQQQLKSEAYE